MINFFVLLYIKDIYFKIILHSMYRDSTELTSPSEDKDAGLDLDLLSMEPKQNFLENSSRDSFCW